MRHSARSAIAVLFVLLAAVSDAASDPAPRRIVSMNPSLTRILVAIGAGDALVGVDEFSAKAEPRVASLPSVGGLYAPSLESVVALRPDLVVIVPSVEQRDFRTRLESLAIPTLDLDPVSFDQVLESIRVLGRTVGREDAARERIEAIERARDAVRRATAGRKPPRTVLILQREPLFVVGKGTFIDDMLRTAGAVNVGAELGEKWPRASAEWLIAAKPEVLLDSDSDAMPARTFWQRWPSLPAVAHDRVFALDAGDVTLPGPDLDRALVRLARALHGDALVLENAP